MTLRTCHRNLVEKVSPSRSHNTFIWVSNDYIVRVPAPVTGCYSMGPERFCHSGPLNWDPYVGPGDKMFGVPGGMPTWFPCRGLGGSHMVPVDVCRLGSLDTPQRRNSIVKHVFRHDKSSFAGERRLSPSFGCLHGPQKTRVENAGVDKAARRNRGGQRRSKRS